MIIQKSWAWLIGLASLIIGILRFFIPVLHANIPPLDGIIHIVTGVGFLLGAWIYKGKYVHKTNLWLGTFYIMFGIICLNIPHIIAGVISTTIALSIK